MLVIMRIDNVIAKFWHVPLVFLCKLTGKSNFFFAQGALLLALLAGLYSYLLAYPDMSLVDASRKVLYGNIAVLFWLAVAMLAEKSEGLQLSEMHPVLDYLFITARAAAVLLVVSDLVYSMPVPVIVKIADKLCFVAALYFAFDNQRGGKSWVGQGVEKLKAGIAKLRSLMPSPRTAPQGA